MKKYFLLLSISVLLLTACEEDPKRVQTYEKGVFIVNEGTFMAGNGTITFYDTTTETVSQNIFLNEAGNYAGDVVQSMTFHGGVPIIVVNGDSKVEVGHGLTFKSVKTITDELIDKPRYVEVINDKAYISVWGAYDENFSLVDSYVVVYDLITGAVDSIDTDEGTENLLSTGNRLFASNFNYGASNTVSVINPAADTLLKNIEVAAGPAGMVVDANGEVWVICVGAFGAENSFLYRINPETLLVEDAITITGSAGVDLATTPDKQNILYTVGKSVFSISIESTDEANDALFDAEDVTSLSTMNVHPTNGNIWVGDAPSFTDPGKVFVYSSTGELLTSFTVGIAPTQIVFKKKL